MADKKNRKSSKRQSSGALARWGLWIGVVGVVCALVLIFLPVHIWIFGNPEIRAFRKEFQKFAKRLDSGIYPGDLEKTDDPALAKMTRLGIEAYSTYKYGEAVGYFRAALIIASDKPDSLALLNLIGVSQFDKGDKREAEQTFLEMIRVSEQAKLGEALAVGLGDIGIVYCTLDQPKKALDYCEKALKIAKQIDNPGIEANQLGNIGNVYQTLGDRRKALDHYQKALKIAKQIDKPGIEAKVLGNIGNVYHDLGEPRKALDHHEKALKIAKEIGNREVEAKVLGNIGLVYRTLGDTQKALEHLQKALKIDEDIGRLEGQAINLGNLGNVYDDLGEPRKALDHHQRALKIAKQIDNLEIEAGALGNIGGIYASSGQFEKALEHYQRARKIFEKIGVRHLVEQTDHNIAVVKKKMGK